MVFESINQTFNAFFLNVIHHLQIKGARLDVTKLFTDSLKQQSFSLETELLAEPHCHRLCVYAIDENFGDSTSSWKCRISLNAPMVLSNQDVFPDNDFTADDYDPAKVALVEDSIILASVGRIVRSDFFRLTPFSPADFGPAGVDSSWKEWKLYLAAIQGPNASTAWRYDTLCEPRFEEPVVVPVEIEENKSKATEEVMGGEKGDVDQNSRRDGREGRIWSSSGEERGGHSRGSRRDRSRSKGRRDRSRSKGRRGRSRSKERRGRSRSKDRRSRSRSKGRSKDRSCSRSKGRDRSKSKERRRRSRSKERRRRSRSKDRRRRSRSKDKRDHSKSKERGEQSGQEEKRDKTSGEEKGDKKEDKTSGEKVDDSKTSKDVDLSRIVRL